mgnify:CR=1 FL=1
MPVFEFVDSVSGAKITDETELARLRKAAPPGVTDVVINPDPTGHVIATWNDVKGNSKSSYSKAHTKESAAEKFERLKQFNKALPKLRRRINEDLEAGVEEAAVLYLIDKTGFRAGSGADTN